MYGDVDFYDLKEVVVTLLERLGITDLEYSKEDKKSNLPSK